mmetsp:Transcript_17913/g.59302  ORF Transcript_17913/g.59302 Transcript_17913/m.59302 type:complete len:214 (+) Transcript_17913:3-644(+)
MPWSCRIAPSGAGVPPLAICMRSGALRVNTLSTSSTAAGLQSERREAERPSCSASFCTVVVSITGPQAFLVKRMAEGGWVWHFSSMERTTSTLCSPSLSWPHKCRNPATSSPTLADGESSGAAPSREASSSSTGGPSAKAPTTAWTASRCWRHFSVSYTLDLPPWPPLRAPPPLRAASAARFACSSSSACSAMAFSARALRVRCFAAASSSAE